MKSNCWPQYFTISFEGSDIAGCHHVRREVTVNNHLRRVRLAAQIHRLLVGLADLVMLLAMPTAADANSGGAVSVHGQRWALREHPRSTDDLRACRCLLATGCRVSNASNAVEGVVKGAAKKQTEVHGLQTEVLSSPLGVRVNCWTSYPQATIQHIHTNWRSRPAGLSIHQQTSTCCRHLRERLRPAIREAVSLS